jgi:isoleucyl-tRNA synthetase
MATELAESVLAKAGLTIEQTLLQAKGSELEFMTAVHPLFADRRSLVINGDHVTLDAGTGCVHTAPAYGVDDFNVCRKYDQLDTGSSMVVNVNSKGRFTPDAGPYEGLSVFKAHEPIFADLKANGAILASEDIVHSYPHCWRCKKPIIFRATEQWFASVNAIKDAAVAACDGINWNPEWGKERMISMIRERADWCISRQRSWGVPIPIFYCEKCGHEYVSSESIDAVAELFAKEGSDGWYTHSAEEILPAGTKCPKCGHDHFTKETDIMDVWFDSGSSHAGVLETRENLRFPADVYLEGGDQYRGWFQSSMLTSIAAKGVAPYKQIITHGWTVDGEGKAMHKSLGNTIAPEDIIKDYGADILRLWVASADYRQDMRISKDILKQLSDMYLKIRNTARYILGNLNDFNADELTPYSQMEELDKWALVRFNKLVERVRDAYDRYEYHTISHGIHNFCAVDMSNFYLDIIKDRLYCDSKDGSSRKSAQTAIYIILDGLVKLLAPILAFTAEEIWAAMPHSSSEDTGSVVFNDIPAVNPEYTFTPEQERKWSTLFAVRTDVNKALELARAQKIVGKPLDAEVTIYVDDTAKNQFSEIEKENLEQLFIVSKVTVIYGAGEGYTGTEFEGITVAVVPSQAPKCLRCWAHNDHVGENAAHPDLCPRCASAVSQ